MSKRATSAPARDYRSPKLSVGARIRRDLVTNRYLYLLLLPAIAYYIIFQYLPMWGIQIAFKNYYVTKGIMGSKWAGLTHFKNFFTSYYFPRVVGNTVLLSGLNILIGFPVPIILAILINEVKSVPFKKTVQTITYLPHFISLVVVCGLVISFLQNNGLINDIIVALGGERKLFLQDPGSFRGIYIISDIWQQAGWGSIIYLSAISAIPQEQYEALRVDGGNLWHEIIHVTIPGITNTMIILLILRVGRLMSLGYEKVLLLYNESTYSTADIISTYVYRRGILNAEYSFSTAVGLFNSVINMVLLLATNFLSNKFGDRGLF